MIFIYITHQKIIFDFYKNFCYNILVKNKKFIFCLPPNWFSNIKIHRVKVPADANRANVVAAPADGANKQSASSLLYIEARLKDNMGWQPNGRGTGLKIHSVRVRIPLTLPYMLRQPNGRGTSLRNQSVWVRIPLTAPIHI